MHAKKVFVCDNITIQSYIELQEEYSIATDIKIATLMTLEVFLTEIKLPTIFKVHLNVKVTVTFQQAGNVNIILIRADVCLWDTVMCENSLKRRWVTDSTGGAPSSECEVSCGYSEQEIVDYNVFPETFETFFAYNGQRLSDSPRNHGSYSIQIELTTKMIAMGIFNPSHSIVLLT
ncbi:hypothetical protein CHS0354_008250 [Potamilus streckersoni]|uniref:Uncharacterized protein n=1 Tax=Potamilus streckersoni TaxID=2493646 RepID=A0AAE0W7U7_9BIVA|nr:hypothetical protein CHS0354_008250 [Potamilus streckersoni]